MKKMLISVDDSLNLAIMSNSMLLSLNQYNSPLKWKTSII